MSTSRLFVFAVVVVIVALCNDSRGQVSDSKVPVDESRKPENSIRFATFNIALNRKKAGGLLEELKKTKEIDGRSIPQSQQAKRIAEVIRRVQPDVLLINELDEADKTLSVFVDNFLERSEAYSKAGYKYFYVAPVNTGVPTGIDLNGDGKKDGPEDAYGYGAFPGQYGMAVLSKYPIDKSKLRTFQKFLWKDMPDMKWPTNPETGKSFYSDQVKSMFRLSSKSHWDIPIKIGDKTIHFLVSHPTPPVFDGPEDRNGLRNADEIRFWKDYVEGKNYIYDDEGKKGGLAEGSHFVIAGDLNADPNDGDSTGNPMKKMLGHRLIAQNVSPASEGAAEASQDSGRANEKHQGNPAFDTGDFNDRNVGNLRIDYVLPSRSLKVVGQGVFWPAKNSRLKELNRASDHHLVWVDLEK